MWHSICEPPSGWSEVIKYCSQSLIMKPFSSHSHLKCSRPSLTEKRAVLFQYVSWPLSPPLPQLTVWHLFLADVEFQFEKASSTLSQTLFFLSEVAFIVSLFIWTVWGFVFSDCVEGWELSFNFLLLIVSETWTLNYSFKTLCSLLHTDRARNDRMAHPSVTRHAVLQ